MFFNLKNKIGRQLFDRNCADVLAIPPARVMTSSDTKVVSQLQHKDVLMYLVAIKSFSARVPVGSVLVLNDGSLNEADQELLARHVPNITVEPIEAYRSPRCPQGGTWERLLAIAQHSKDGYVIQLDADTVAIGALPEVEAAVTCGTSFALGTWDGQKLETMAERAADARRLNPDGPRHVQVAAEQVFDQMPGFAELRYVRGCSGFAGFARNAASLEFIEEFSLHMGSLLLDRWKEWGSEQLMSNVVIANSPNAIVLPHPQYCDCNHIAAETTFIHFIGDCRFNNGVYREVGRDQIRLLSK